jgi:hypothetical protein
MLQEALLREAVKFEHDAALGSDIAVAIVNQRGEEVVDLRPEWLPVGIYGEEEYTGRILKLSRRRYYSRDPEDKAGILRYTKVNDHIIDLGDIPPPSNERELAWLLSFYWHVDQAYSSLPVLVQHREEGRRPGPDLLRAIQEKYEAGLSQGLELPPHGLRALAALGLLAPK